MAGMLDYLSQLTGQTPQQIRLGMIGQGLTGLGAGLLSGRTPGEGLSRGLLGFQEAQSRGLEDAMRQATFGYNTERMASEREKDAAKKKALDDYIMSQPLEQQPRLRAAAEAGALDNIIADQFKPAEAPKTRDVRRGTQLVTEEWNPATQTWNEVGSGPAWAPATQINMPKPPPSIEERDQQVLLTGDPSSPEYAMSFQRIYGTPVLVPSGIDENGKTIVTPQYLPVPPNVRKPAYLAGDMSAPPVAQPAAPAPPISQPSAAPATAAPLAGAPNTSGLSSGSPVTTGVAPKRDQPLTEGQRRNQQLYQVTQPELTIVEKNFDALTEIGNQAGGTIPVVSNYFTSPEYQQAENSLRVIVANYLYSVSGATANPGEVANQVAVLTPRPGESKESIENKRARVRTMVESIKTGIGQPPQPQGAQPQVLRFDAQGNLIP